ncbi:hypothetical protein [Candidatus Enterococcus clewellii]|uniref:Uncharacterized protein n=1 Tax=Candidatus Enterococcus clewellii TaxID=1834193 RepID=A0A242K835_9ENTE|nr:hypothetical protein [Enterococcus sp. 9E7_DIV0242]OTP17335.1 hypothetical protein A5888_001473 [Enterococcus sp. 9E7_DIV0242]
MIRMNMEKEVFKEVIENREDLLTLIKKEQTKLPMIPYETLEMIQEANGEKLPLLRLFNCLEEQPSMAETSEKLDFRLIIIFEEVSYVKQASEKKIFLGNIACGNQLARNAHYIILLKNSPIQKDNFLAKISSILDEEMIEYKKETIDIPLLAVPPPWEVEQVIKTNLTITEKI